jgi:gluconolactonase
MKTPDLVRAEFATLDARFARCRGDEWWERHFAGGRWTEGPVYVPAARQVLFSDIPNNRTLRWDQTTGTVSEWSRPSGYANGRTIDRQGRVLTCEQGGRRVTRTEHDGSTTVLADRIDGKRFNSPNDLVVSSDGSVWFTAPSYGIDSDFEGERAAPEPDGCHVYRRHPGSGAVEQVTADFERPNGLAFSVNETVLCVVDSRRNHIRRFAVSSAYELTDDGILAESTVGQFDGIRLDADGNVWAAAGDGVHCIAPDGTLLGKILLPEPVSNLTFGGAKGNRLFVTATRSLYSILLTVNGATTKAGTRNAR